MSQGAQTPEELETLLEDALVVQDSRALVRLFEDWAVAAVGPAREARGGEQIARLLWERSALYLAGPRRVLQARDTALVVADAGINVVRRHDEGWRYAISLLDTNQTKGAGT